MVKGEARGEARGLAKGEERGLTKGKAEDVLTVLRTRGVRLTRAQREEIRACEQPRRLQAWLRRACTATTAAEVFEPRRRAS